MNTTSTRDGRKIVREHENPIDNVLIDVSTALNVPLVNTLVTPNLLTAWSFAIGLMAAWFVTQGMFISATLFTIISYILDCMDGNMVRKYHMVTAFGDWFDHICDILKYTALFYAVLVTKYLSARQKVVFGIVVSALLILMLMHLGCQELNRPSKHASDSMTPLEPLCPNKQYIQYTRFFGMGTWVASMCIMFLLF